MKSLMIMRPGLVVAVLAASALAATQAMAQSALPQPTAMGPVVQGSNGNQASQPSVAGLPGARRAAPVNQGTINSELLSPNDQLFDAINRGDITAARDALARGADLGATDAVGQTPIDLSVSLGRNNITFLLVTMLHAGGGEITDAQGPMNQPPPNTLGLSDKDQKAVSTPVGFFSGSAAAAAAKRKRASEAEVASAPAAPAYQGGSGSANPQAGFVGFGSSAQ